MSHDDPVNPDAALSLCLRELVHESRGKTSQPIDVKEIVQRARGRRLRRRAGGIGVVAVLVVVSILVIAPSVSSPESKHIEVGNDAARRGAGSVFPPSIYPAPRSVDAGGLGPCPSTIGLVPAKVMSADAVLGLATKFLTSRSVDDVKKLSDRTYWSNIVLSQLPEATSIARDQVVVGPLAGDLYTTVRTYCGQATSASTWEVGVCTAGGSYDACSTDHPATVADLLVLDRFGTYLVWLIGT